MSNRKKVINCCLNRWIDVAEIVSITGIPRYQVIQILAQLNQITQGECIEYKRISRLEVVSVFAKFDPTLQCKPAKKKVSHSMSDALKMMARQRAA